MFLLKFLIHFPLSLFSLSLSALYSLSQSSLFSLSPIPSFSSDQFFVLIKTSSCITFCFTNGIFFFAFCFTPWHFFFNNAFYKLVKTNFDSWAPTCRTWRNNGYIAGSDLALSGPPLQIIFLSLSLSPLYSLSQSTLFSLSSFLLASLPSLLALLINSLSS